jgi:hypothetical protein
LRAVVGGGGGGGDGREEKNEEEEARGKVYVGQKEIKKEIETFSFPPTPRQERLLWREKSICLTCQDKMRINKTTEREREEEGIEWN